MLGCFVETCTSRLLAGYKRKMPIILCENNNVLKRCVQKEIYTFNQQNCCFSVDMIDSETFVPSRLAHETSYIFYDHVS